MACLDRRTYTKEVCYSVSDAYKNGCSALNKIPIGKCPFYKPKSVREKELKFLDESWLESWLE